MTALTPFLLLVVVLGLLPVFPADVPGAEWPPR